MIPLFRLGFGLSAIVSTATSLFTIVPTSIAGCITHLKNKTCIAKIGLIAGVAGACTSPLGVLAATNSPDIAIMACAAIIIAYSAITMFRKAIKMPKRTDSDLSMRATLQRFRMEFADETEEMPDGRQDSGERTGQVQGAHVRETQAAPARTTEKAIAHEVQKSVNTIEAPMTAKRPPYRCCDRTRCGIRLGVCGRGRWFPHGSALHLAARHHNEEGFRHQLDRGGDPRDSWRYHANPAWER